MLEATQRVAFIGLGYMGFPMTSNLVRSGYSVVDYNQRQETHYPFTHLGGNVAQMKAKSSSPAYV